LLKPQLCWIIQFLVTDSKPEYKQQNKRYCLDCFPLSNRQSPWKICRGIESWNKSENWHLWWLWRTKATSPTQAYWTRIWYGIFFNIFGRNIHEPIKLRITKLSLLQFYFPLVCHIQWRSFPVSPTKKTVLYATILQVNSISPISFKQYPHLPAISYTYSIFSPLNEDS